MLLLTVGCQGYDLRIRYLRENRGQVTVGAINLWGADLNVFGTENEYIWAYIQWGLSQHGHQCACSTFSIFSAIFQWASILLGVTKKDPVRSCYPL